MSDLDEKREEAAGISNKAVKSVKWTFFAEILPRISAPIVILFLARLLTPADFGIVAIATIVIGFAAIFQSLGFEQALIQRETDVNTAANIVFWSNVSLSLVIYVAAYVAAPYVADFFHTPAATAVIRVLCLQIVLTAFVTVHSSLLQRGFQFKTIFLARSANSVIPLIVTVPLAFFLHNVWALVIGSLVGSIVQLTLFWYFSKWRPEFSYDIALAKKLMRFGLWVTLEMFLGWVILYGDNLVVGNALGVYALGVYTVGWNLVTLVFGLVMSPLTPVAYSSFSRLQSNLNELRAGFLKATKFIVTLALPLGAGLAVTAQPVASLVFGQRWVGIEIVIAGIGLVFANAWLVGINGEAYRAIGRPDMTVKLLVIAVLYYIPVYILAAPKGLLVFCIARLAVGVAGLPLHFYVANRLFGVPFTYLKNLVKLPFIATLIMSILVYCSVLILDPFVGLLGCAKLGFVLMLAVASYGLILWVLDKDYTVQTYKLIRAAIH